MSSIAPPAHTRSSKTTDSWITPRWVIETFGPFDLDPCACDPQPWPCATEQYTDGGLLMPWAGLVWLNPPYGRETGRWLSRLAAHGNGIALVFARTDTRMFFEQVWPRASALLFLKGRLTFHRPDGSKPKEGHNSGGPSVLIGYGQTAAERLRKNATRGAFVKL